MKINPPSIVRGTIYGITTFLNAFVAVYVGAGEVVGLPVLAVLAGLNALVGIMAAVNLTPEK